MVEEAEERERKQSVRTGELANKYKHIKDR